MTARLERSFNPRIFGAAVTVIVLWTPITWPQPGEKESGTLQRAKAAASTGETKPARIATQPAEPLWRFDTHG